MKRLSRILCLALCLALLPAAFASACAEEEAPEAQRGHRLRLGSSVYTVMIGDDFVAGEMTGADLSAGMIGCYQSDATGLELDVYQLDKGDAPEDLAHFTLSQACSERDVVVVWPTDKVNDIDLGWYICTRELGGEAVEATVYTIDSGSAWVSLVFRHPVQDTLYEDWDIVATLEYMSLKQIRLGTSRFTLTVPDDFREGAISDEDIADDQVAYWYSDETTLDFDVYQFSKEGLPATLAEYVVEESSTYPAVTELVADGEINLIPVAWYRAVDECDEGEYDTITYIVDAGDEYVEVVFWLDGPTANAEADYIIHNLIDEALTEAGGNEAPAA